ncbi:MAG: 4-hydroxy-tetrahydrodipicolinate reductase [Phycisphaeraceae bacterium]|nr:4-hydroxy-tetrahydrodipicolinate reductase [Phycisphaeraceae bacterium]
MTRLAIHGAAGRMGRRLIALAAQDDLLSPVAAIEHAGHADLGTDAGALAGGDMLGFSLAESLGDTDCDALIDFSLPKGFRRALADCVERKLPIVVGTTGLIPEDEAALHKAAKTIPVLQATNFSLVVNVLWKLASEAAQLLEGYDIEVLEAHHRFKQDAPSGTALTLAHKLCEATGRDPEKNLVFARHGDAPRNEDDITVQTLRIGDDPGQHTAYFAGLGERLEIKHVSTSRDSYALGALRAAKWLADKQPGRYDMADVLGL